MHIIPHRHPPDARFRAAPGPVGSPGLESQVDVRGEVVAILESVLNLAGRSVGFAPETRLLGAVSELDSMAVVSVITALEDRFGIEVRDDEIDGAAFATVASLVAFVEGKLAA